MIPVCIGSSPWFKMEVIKPSHIALCILSSMLFYPDEEDPSFAPEVQHKLRDILTREVRRADEVAHPGLAALLQSVQVRPGSASAP